MPLRWDAGSLECSFVMDFGHNLNFDENYHHHATKISSNFELAKNKMQNQLKIHVVVAHPKHQSCSAGRSKKSEKRQ